MARILLIFCIVLSILICSMGRVRDICSRKPTIKGLCVSSTLGIYYDAETQNCKYMGCSPGKRLFPTLQDCEKICNSQKHRRRLENIDESSE